MDYWTKGLDDGTQTRGSLVKTMLMAAHTYKRDATWGWVADVLDNKNSVAHYFAVEQGLTYSTDENSIIKGMMISSSITATDTAKAVGFINISDFGFSLAPGSLKNFSLGGSITGLTRNGLILSNNGGLLHPTSTATSFFFSNKIPEGAQYSVTINSQPMGFQACMVEGSFPKSMGNTDVNNTVIHCEDSAAVLTTLAGSGWAFSDGTSTEAA